MKSHNVFLLILTFVIIYSIGVGSFICFIVIPDKNSSGIILGLSSTINGMIFVYFIYTTKKLKAEPLRKLRSPLLLKGFAFSLIGIALLNRAVNLTVLAMPLMILALICYFTGSILILLFWGVRPRGGNEKTGTGKPVTGSD